VVVGAGASGLTVANRLSEDLGRFYTMPHGIQPANARLNRCKRTHYRGWRFVS
jgi:cation diffusion facilitator CzcD-associated flavoprotein CzcO